MAAFAVEAFVNELATLANVRLQSGDEPSAAALRQVLDQAEAERAGTMLKLQLVHLVCRGAPLNRGLQPAQDLELLFAFRNLLVHSKPEPVALPVGDENVEEGLTKIVARFVGRGIIERPQPELKGWSRYLLVTPVARWAVWTACMTFHWLARLQSDPTMRQMLEHLNMGIPSEEKAV